MSGHSKLQRSKQRSPVWCSHVPTPAASQQFVRSTVACLDVETCCGFICVKRLEGMDKHPPTYCLEVSLKVWHQFHPAWWAEYRFIQLIKVLILLLLSCAKHGTALFSLSELPKRKATHRCHSFNACCVSSGPAVWFARSTSGADSSTCWSCSDSLDTCLPSLIFASMRYLLDATALCRDEWDWGLQLAVMGSLQGELMAISVRWDHLL